MGRTGSASAKFWPATADLVRLAGALTLCLAFLVPAAVRAQSELPEADRADVARVENYLNGFTSLQSRFVQVGPAGDVAAGDFYLRRPGKLRFQYDPPVPLLIVADGFRLILHDYDLNHTDAWPVAATPLAPLLARTVDFSGFEMALRREPGILRLTLVDPDRADEGSVTLVFEDQPLALRQWVVLDARKMSTVVTLDSIAYEPDIANALFVFLPPDEEEEEEDSVNP